MQKRIQLFQKVGPCRLIRQQRMIGARKSNEFRVGYTGGQLLALTERHKIVVDGMKNNCRDRNLPQEVMNVDFINGRSQHYGILARC